MLRRFSFYVMGLWGRECGGMVLRICLAIV